MLYRAICASIALTGPYGPDSSLRRHNVLSETQQFGPCCTCINRSGGAVSDHRSSPEAGSAMRRQFDRDVGSRWWCTSTELPTASEAEWFSQFTTDPAGRRRSSGTELSTTAAEAEWFSQFTTDSAGRRRSASTELPATAAEAEWFNQFTANPAGRWRISGSLKRQLPGRLSKR